MSKHSPAPWRASEFANNVGNVTSARGGVIAFVYTPLDPEFRSEGVANMRLVTASPRLLEALKRCLRYGDLLPELYEDFLMQGAGLGKETADVSGKGCGHTDLLPAFRFDPDNDNVPGKGCGGEV